MKHELKFNIFHSGKLIYGNCQQNGSHFLSWPQCVNTLRPRQNGRCFADDTFKLIFLNENVRISIKISMKFVPYGPINNIPALVQIMAWRLTGAKPLSEPMMVSLLTHICVTQPQWIKSHLQNKMYLTRWKIIMNYVPLKMSPWSVSYLYGA